MNPDDRGRGRSRSWLIAAAALAFAAGCASETIGFTETVGIDEPLDGRDVRAALAVLEASVIDRAALPVPYLPPPEWSATRTLPIADLTAEERRALEAEWSPEEVAARLPAGPAFDGALRSRRLTRQQFAAIVLALGAAASRSHVAEGIDPARLAHRAAAETASLADDGRPFSSLPPEERYRVVRRAGWLTIGDRAARLAAVPDENVELVGRLGDRLAKALPEAYFRDPFAGVWPRHEDFGVPFDDAGRPDADLIWSAESAVVGFDPSEAGG